MKLHHYLISLLTLLLAANVQHVRADEDTPRVLISTSTCAVNGHMLFPWVSSKQSYFSVLVWYLNTKQNNSYWKEAPTLTVDGHSVTLTGIAGDDPIKYDPGWNDDFEQTLACRDGDVVHYWVRWRDSFKVDDSTLPTSMAIGGGSENENGRNDDYYIIVDVIFPTNTEGEPHTVSLSGKFIANHDDKGVTYAQDMEGLTTLTTHKTNSPFSFIEVGDDLEWTAAEMLKLTTPKFTKENAWGRYQVDYDGTWSDKIERGTIELTNRYSNPDYRKATEKPITYYQYTAIDWADTVQAQSYTEQARFSVRMNYNTLEYYDVNRKTESVQIVSNSIWLNRIEPCGVKVTQSQPLERGTYSGVASLYNSTDITFKCMDQKRLKGVKLQDFSGNTICEWSGNAKECTLTLPKDKEMNYIDLTFDRYAYGMAIDFKEEAKVKSNTFPKPINLTAKSDEWAKSIKLSWEAQTDNTTDNTGNYVVWRGGDSIGTCISSAGMNTTYFEYTDEKAPEYDKEYSYHVSFNPHTWGKQTEPVQGLTADVKATIKRQLDLSALTVTANEDKNGYLLKWQLNSALNTTDYYFNIYRIVVTPEMGIPSAADFKGKKAIGTVNVTRKDKGQEFSYNDKDVNSTDTYAYLVSIHAQEADFYTGPTIPEDSINSSSVTGATASCGEYTDQVVVRWEADIKGQDSLKFIIYQHKILENENYVNSLDDANHLRWDSLGTVIGKGDDSEHTYSFQDKSAVPGYYYAYAIKGIPNNSDQKITFQGCTGFVRATATVHGHVTYQSGKYAVEGVRMQVTRETDETQVEESLEVTQQFRSLSLNKGGGVHWNVSQSNMRSYFGYNSFSVQMYANPDTGQSGNSLLDIDGQLRITLGDCTAEGYALKVNTGNEEKTSTLRIKPNQFTSISFTYDNGEGWIHLLGRDSIGCIASEKLLTSANIDWKTAAGHVAVGSLKDSTMTMLGYIDEVRFWSKPLTQAAVLKNYNHVLGGSEEGLVAYWTFDEGISTLRAAYDYSKTGNAFNQNHAHIVCGIRNAQTLPTSDQFGLFSMTDANGYYSTPGIPLIGEKTGYKINPSKGEHQFTTSDNINFTVTADVLDFTRDFTDISSFNVKGFVYYENTTYPVDSCMFYIDDSEDPVKNTSGHVVVSDGDGAFTISVPVGEHYIRIEKPGHTFKYEGRYPEPDSLHNFNDSISHLTFTDQTKVVLAGRVVGGNVERDKPIGFGQSNANIGAATLTLIPSTDIRTAPRMNVVFNDQEGTYDDNPNRLEYETVQKDYIKNCSAYTPGGEATDSLKMIIIHTDPASGEFAVMVPPIPYTIETRMDHNDNVTFDDKEVVNASNPLHCDTARVTMDSGEEKFCYHAAYIPQYLSTPVISVKQKGNDVGAFGDEYTVLKKDDGGSSENVAIYTYDNGQLKYNYDYPIFSFGGIYDFTISSYQPYVNYDSGEAVETREPTSGKVMVQNEMFSGSDTLSVGVLDSLGTFHYQFTGLLPNIESPYTRLVDIGVQIGEVVFKWNWDNANGGPLKGILFGPVKTGTSFVTKAPDEVINILRDPYGNASTTTWKKGESISHSYKVNASGSLNIMIDQTSDMGSKVEFYYGVPTCLVEDGGKITLNINFGSSLDLSLIRNQVITWNTTTTQSISTASDAIHVGSMGDVFVGMSTAVCFGDGKNVQFINNQQGGWRVGTTDAIVMGDSLTTDFAYSQYFIINQMIPELRDMRNAMLQLVSKSEYDNDIQNFVNNGTEPIYKTWRTPDDPDFGAPNDTLQMKENKANRCVYGDSYAVFYPASDKGYMEDMVNDCNQQIMNWENLLALNEEDKVMAMTKYYNDDKTTNVSFETGAPVDKNSEQTHNLTEGAAFKHDATGTLKFGWKYDTDVSSEYFSGNGTWGIKLNRMRQPSYEYASSSKDAYTYSMRETTPENSHQLTFYPSPSDYSFVCVQTGGQTSQPYEGADKSRYYEPGQHTFSVATKQIEVPTIHVDKYIVSDVPAGGTATINLTLTNPTDAQITKQLNFDLWVDNDKFGKMAAVTFNGEAPTGNKYPIKLSANDYKAEVALQVKALTEDIVHIDSLHLFFSSNGQPTLYDDVYLGIHFQPHAESIKLDVTPDMVNTATDSTLTLRAYDYNINSTILDAVKLQQRLSGSNEWTTLRRWVKQNPVGSNESLLTANCDTVISMRSEIFYPDATYEFRAVTECSLQGEPTEGASDIIAVIKDITLPKPLYLPEPADGVLGAGDNISVTFDEDIFPSLREADNFIVQSVLNTDSIAHEVALRLDGTHSPVATTQTGLTLGGTSFTICTWLKHEGQGGTVLQHGDGANAFRINIDTHGHLVVMITDEDGTAQPYTSTLTIPASLWVYLGATYDISKGTLSAWYCSGDDDVTLMSGVPVGQKATSKGNIYLGENLTGAMHELSLYTTALDWYTGIKPQMYLGKSYSTPSLVGYWRLDEGHGSTSEDRARGRHMLLASSASWYLENENKAMVLDGNTHAAISLANLSTSSNDSYLIELWARTDGEAAKDSVQIFGIDDDRQLDLNVVKGQLQLMAKGQTLTAAGNWTADEWHHVALNVLRTGTSPAFNLILDGISVLSANADKLPALSGINLHLGRGMEGAIDEVRLWHGTHTQNDIIENMYNRMDPKNAGGLVGYYPMEYTHYDDYNQRIYEFSLRNMADGAADQTAIVAMPETGTLKSTIQTPGLKSAPHKSNLDINYAVKDNVVTITLEHSAAALEDCTVSTTLMRYYDLHNNIGTPITWTFRVKQNPLLWETDKKEVSVLAGQGGTFTTRLTNYGVDDQQWQFPELPSWLQASETSGIIPPNGYVDITFTVSNSNPIGKYFATVSARTTIHQNGGNSTLDTPLDISVTVEGERPNWTVASYPLDMTVTGQICVNGIMSTDTDDMVGAFIYDKKKQKMVCVGKGRPTYNSQRDAYYVNMMVVKGDNDMNGSTVNFRIYDASSGKTYPLVATTPAVVFNVDTQVGSTQDPIIWENEEKLLQSEPLDMEWSSISLYLKPDTSDQTIFDILGDHIEELYINKTIQLTHSNGVWSSTYKPITPGLMMKVYLNTADTLHVIGDEANPADWPQTIAKQSSTWIGVPTQAAMTLDEAFAGIEPEEGDVVKGDDYASVFENNHWTGDLTAILPGRGYVYTSMANEDKELVFPAKSGSGLTTYHTARHGLPASRKYAHSMVALCTVHGDNQEALQDAVIEVYDQNGELRGRSKTLVRDSLHILFISGHTEGEPLLFTAQLTDGRKIVRMIPKGFQRDSRLGTLRVPFVIDTTTDGIETLQLAKGTIAVYTLSGIPVYSGPADDFYHQQARNAEPLIIVESTDDGHPRVYKLK